MAHVDPVNDLDSREAALRRASRSAVWNGALPSTFQSLIAGTEVETCSYRRVAHRIARRTIVRRLAPAHGSRASQVEPLPDPSTLDPWSVDPATLPSTSERVAVCPTCTGQKKVECPECRGSGRVRCVECGGSGRVAGKRGMKNCPACRGRKTVRCDNCRKGMVDCPTCMAIGRVRAWLDVEIDLSVQIKVHPQSSITALHRGLQMVEDLDRAPDTYRIPRVHDSGWVDELPESLPGELQATLHPVSERIIKQRVQGFQSEVFHLTYATRTSTGIIDVSGKPPGILPGSNWWPLRRRLLLAAGAGLAMFIGAAAFHGMYVQRAPWFREHGSGGAIAFLGLLAAITTCAAVAEAWLPRPVRRAMRIKVMAALLSAAWLGMGLFWFLGGPTPEGVQASLARGELLTARQEMEAIQVIGASPDGLEDTLELLTAREQEAERARRRAADEQHLERVTTAPSLAQAIERLSESWWSQEPEGQARAAVIARANAEVEQHYGENDPARLGQIAELVEPIDASTAARARSLSTLAAANQCRERQDFACAITSIETWKEQPAAEPALMNAYEQVREQTKAELRQWLANTSFEQEELAARKGALERAIANAEIYRQLAGEAPPVPLARLRAQLARAEQQLAQERRRAAALEKRRQAEEERKARRRAAQERRRQRMYAPLLCNDGTLSPSCTCSGSWRGCCSHHGGVAGCSR